MMNLRRKRRKSIWAFVFACLLLAGAVFSVFFVSASENGRLYSAVGNRNKAPRLVGGANYAGGNDGADIVNNGSGIIGDAYATDTGKAGFPANGVINWFYFALIFLAIAIIALIIILVPKRKK